ncbi:MAG: hypothetical protein GY861_16895 [bacterium]|nr:hypothetical protein [bacterium]
MAAITNPGTNVTEFSGSYKLLSLYNLSLSSASDALTLSYTDNGISEIQNVIVGTNAGTDANFQTVSASFSGLVVTVTSANASGVEATDWTSATCNMIVIGK